MKTGSILKKALSGQQSAVANDTGRAVLVWLVADSLFPHVASAAGTALFRCKRPSGTVITPPPLDSEGRKPSADFTIDAQILNGGTEQGRMVGLKSVGDQGAELPRELGRFLRMPA